MRKISIYDINIVKYIKEEKRFMQEKKIIAIFGGSFNPPLKSHLLLAKRIINEINNIEKLIFVPVSTNYKKENLEQNEHRYNMLKLFCMENKKMDVSRIEIDSKRQLFTIETLEYMKTKYEENDIYFILGTDNLKLLSEWHNAHELVHRFKFIVLERQQDDVEEIIMENQFLRYNFKNYIKIKNDETSEFSSSLIRDMLKHKIDVSKFMPKYIYEYIKKNNLYE